MHQAPFLEARPPEVEIVGARTVLRRGLPFSRKPQIGQERVLLGARERARAG
jgi:hypothetical protein